MLGKRERLIALILVGLLIITGALEIAGMFFLFGYISVLGAGTVGNVGPTFVNQIYIAIAGAYYRRLAAESLIKAQPKTDQGILKMSELIPC